MVEKDISNLDKKRKYKYGIAPNIIILIGIVTFGAQTFGYLEAELLNTYITHVLELQYIYVGIMVACSAIMGLIFLFVWGIISDNTRSKYGRRRPYILLGGLVCGISLIVFGYSPNYLMVFLIDVIIIGIASNAYYAAQRVLIPDLIDIDYRGRINSRVNVFGLFGFLLPIILTFVANEIYTIPDPSDPTGEGLLLTQLGHQFLLIIGGIVTLTCAIIGFIFLKNTKKSISDLPEKKKFMEEIRITFNLAELKNHREFFKLVIAQTIVYSGASVIIPYVFNFVLDLGLKTLDLAVVFGIAAPIMLVSIFLLGKSTDRIGRKKTMILMVTLTSPGFILVPLSTELGSSINIILLSIGFAAALIGMLALMIPMDVWAFDLLPEGRKGQFLGILNVRNTLSQVIGALSAGTLATILDLSGLVTRPIAWIFILVPFFFIGSIPLLRRIEETLKEEV